MAKQRFTYPRPSEFRGYRYIVDLGFSGDSSDLAVSCLLFALGGDPEQRCLAQLLLESPAGVLLLGAVGLAFLLDRLQN